MNKEYLEALECWNWLNATIPQWCREKDKDNQDTLIPIKQALINAQEQEKVLEIILEKNVNMFGFKRDIKQLGKRFTYKYYQSNLGNYHSGFNIQELTEEEFNTLKRYFEKIFKIGS